MLPTFETDRLILKPRTTEHLEECLKMDKDPEVTKYIPGVWDGGQEHIAFLRKRIAKSYPPGLGYWSIFSKDNSEEFLGWVHLLPTQNDEQTTEIGWRLKRGAWGKGYVTEAARTIFAYAFGMIGSERLVAETHSENYRSKKVMERLGFKYIRDFMYEDKIPSSSYEIKKYT